MTGFMSKAGTALALGLPNIARAAGYRAGVKLGLNPVRRLKAAVPQGPFFRRQHWVRCQHNLFRVGRLLQSCSATGHLLLHSSRQTG